MNMAWVHLLIRNWSNAQNCYLPAFRLLEVVRDLINVDLATSRSSTLRPCDKIFVYKETIAVFFSQCTSNPRQSARLMRPAHLLLQAVGADVAEGSGLGSRSGLRT